MFIQQEENGNIVIINSSGEVQHILPMAYVHKHPRFPNEAILITSSSDFKKEEDSISLLSNSIFQINGKSFKGDVNKLLTTISKEIALKGSIAVKDSTPKTKEQDPKYVEYLQANDFEKFIIFLRKYNSFSGGIQKKDDKIIQEEFMCQFNTFIIQAKALYAYRGTSKAIDTITLVGNTKYVNKPVKRYIYGADNKVTGYKYEEI